MKLKIPRKLRFTYGCRLPHTYTWPQGIKSSIPHAYSANREGAPADKLHVEAHGMGTCNVEYWLTGPNVSKVALQNPHKRNTAGRRNSLSACLMLTVSGSSKGRI